LRSRRFEQINKNLYIQIKIVSSVSTGKFKTSMTGKTVSAAGAILFTLCLGLMPVSGEIAVAAAQPPAVNRLMTGQLPYPYDESADAHAEVEAAIKRAADEHRMVLLDFGGNWCPDCRMTAGVLAMDEVKPWIARTFEVVMIDIGRLNKNMDIGERYGVTIKAVPTFILLDGQGRRINAGNPAALKDARGMTPQAIIDTIYGWTQ
jgi:thiol-disulfide isomerase/thioredoxin